MLEAKAKFTEQCIKALSALKEYYRECDEREILGKKYGRSKESFLQRIEDSLAYKEFLKAERDYREVQEQVFVRKMKVVT